MGNFISWLNKNLPQDPNQGSALEPSQPESVWGMIDTLIPVLVISAIYILLFLFFRRTQRRYYAPRTYLGSLGEEERTPPLPNGWFNWMGPFWKMPDTIALTHQGLDAYLFIRFLRICTVICFVSLCITWPILFPVNATGGMGLSQLEILSYSNIDINKKKNYLYAHVFVGWVVYGFLMYMITRECIFYINLRQAYLLNPHYAKRISARTVLFTSVPDKYLNEDRIRGMFNNSVKNVWICGDPSEIDEIVEERDKVAIQLEKAEITLLKTVNKARIKDNKKKGVVESDGTAAITITDVETGSISRQYITDKERPQHRLGPLGLVGKKVDTIEWGRSELQKLIPKVNSAQREWRDGNFKKVRAVFVEFHTQADAQAGYQVVTHHQVLHMDPKAIGVRPIDVVWKNLALPWWQLIIRKYVVYAFIAALIIFWAIPVGIIGIISQVSTLENIPGLTWIKDIPKPILGVISGLLPSVALSILMSLVPIIMRLCAKLAGLATMTQVELFTQQSYFIFQVVQVFLVQTLTNAASTAIVQIAKNPESVFSILSTALPTTSNFYISYFIVQGLTIAVGVVTEVVGLFVFKILYKLLARTPRDMYQKWTNLSAVSWGSVMPVFTNIAVISITYAIIAPIMLFWSTIGMGLFYLAYRYNVLFVADTEVDTQGMIYPRALKQLFAGIYLAEICMVGMFIISKAAGPAVLMFVFLILTILYNVTLLKTLNPLLHGLPRSLQAEEEALQRANSVEAARSAQGESLANNNTNSLDSTNPAKVSASEVTTEKSGTSAKNGNFISKFCKPWKYNKYSSFREILVTGEQIDIPMLYSTETEAEAYLPPSVSSPTPVLWIPADPAGVSKEEIVFLRNVITMSDEGSTLDEKNHISWDSECEHPPIWSEKVYY